MADPIISRGRVRVAVGLEVDSLDVALAGGSDVTVQGLPLADFARRGGFDGARVEVRQHYAPAWGSASVGSLHVFEGRVSEAEARGMRVDLRVASDLELLDQPIPRWVFQAQCRHRIYSTGCGVNPASFQVGGTAQTFSTAGSIVTGLSQADGYFELGRIRFTSGVLAGERRTIRAWGSGIATPVTPFSAAPAVGDSFIMLPGCDRTRATCGAKFSNTANFGGQPHIPAPELSY